jgi:ATP synthase protein I
MAEDETDEVPKLPPDSRLESLDKRLDRLQQEEAKRTAKRKPDPSYQAGQLVLSNLIGAPAGGFIIGFVLDKWLGTQPWLLLIMLFLGFVGGFMNVMRISRSSTGDGADGQR